MDAFKQLSHEWSRKSRKLESRSRRAVDRQRTRDLSMLEAINQACPECGDTAEKEDNGSVTEPTLLCTHCGYCFDVPRVRS